MYQEVEKWEGDGQKSPSSKAAALLVCGAYAEYVSTAKWRERNWRVFSTFPLQLVEIPIIVQVIYAQLGIFQSGHA